MEKSCLTIGDLNIDIIFYGLSSKPAHGSEVLSKGYYIDIGGSGGIFSSVLSQLKVKTSIFSKVGDDYFGQFLLKKLEGFDVGINRVLVDKNNSTGVTISIPYKEDKYQISSLNVFKNMDFNKIDKINDFSHIHIPSFFAMRSNNNEYSSFIKKLKKCYGNITISLDSNDDPDNRWDKEIFKIFSEIDILFLNEKESLKITGETDEISALGKLENYVETVILKLGSKGYVAATPEGRYQEGSIPNSICDTTGAGDNFDAGFIYGYLNNLSHKDSLKIANICGSHSIKYPGGVSNKERFIELNRVISESVLKF